MIDLLVNWQRPAKSPSVIKQINIKYALLGSQLITINLSSFFTVGRPVLNNCSLT